MGHTIWHPDIIEKFSLTYASPRYPGRDYRQPAKGLFNPCRMPEEEGAGPALGYALADTEGDDPTAGATAAFIPTTATDPRQAAAAGAPKRPSAVSVDLGIIHTGRMQPVTQLRQQQLDREDAVSEQSFNPDQGEPDAMARCKDPEEFDEAAQRQHRSDSWQLGEEKGPEAPPVEAVAVQAVAIVPSPGLALDQRVLFAADDLGRSVHSDVDGYIEKGTKVGTGSDVSTPKAANSTKTGIAKFIDDTTSAASDIGTGAATFMGKKFEETEAVSTKFADKIGEAAQSAAQRARNLITAFRAGNNKTVRRKKEIKKWK